jgi:hypothetical protein
MANTAAVERPEPQTVQLAIGNLKEEGKEKKHLRLESELDKIALSRGAVVWDVSVGRSGASEVILWFPERHPLFVDSSGAAIREVRVPISYSANPNFGSGTSSPLLLNSGFPRGNADPYVMPLAIFCDINAGQDESEEFEQKGRQMVDGKHSHPECNVGP